MDTLPDEIVTKIFTYLPYMTICKTKKVCRRFGNIILKNEPMGQRLELSTIECTLLNIQDSLSAKLLITPRYVDEERPPDTCISVICTEHVVIYRTDYTPLQRILGESSDLVNPETRSHYSLPNWIEYRTHPVESIQIGFTKLMKALSIEMTAWRVIITELVKGAITRLIEPLTEFSNMRSKQRDARIRFIIPSGRHLTLEEIEFINRFGSWLIELEYMNIEGPNFPYEKLKIGTIIFIKCQDHQEDVAIHMVRAWTQGRFVFNHIGFIALRLNFDVSDFLSTQSFVLFKETPGSKHYKLGRAVDNQKLEVIVLSNNVNIYANR